MMKDAILTTLLVVLSATGARAAYVNSGVSNFQTVSSFTCNPNAAYVAPVNRSGWSATADSVTYGAVAGAITGSGAWITGAGLPHWIKVDMGAAYSFSVITIMPNQTNAVATNYTLDVSADNTTWTNGVESSPTYPSATVSLQSWTLSTTYTYRYFRINATAGETYTSMNNLFVGNMAGGSVTAGNGEVIGVSVTGSTGITVSSTHVGSFVLDNSGNDNNHIYLFRGTATSSGAETITVTLASGSANMGGVCGEYTLPGLDAKNATGSAPISVTTTKTVDDVVAIISCQYACDMLPGGGFTQRQGATSTGATYLALADQSVTSNGTYTLTMDSRATVLFLDALYVGGGGGVARHRIIQE